MIWFLWSGVMQPDSLSTFFFFFTIAIDNPYLLNKTFTSILMPGSVGTRKLDRTLLSSIHCFQQTEVHYFIYHVLLSHDQMTLVQSLPFLREETEVLGG